MPGFWYHFLPKPSEGNIDCSREGTGALEHFLMISEYGARLSAILMKETYKQCY